MGNATGKLHQSSLHSNMNAFDQLPRAMREALANADHNWSARHCLTELRKPFYRRRSEFRNAQAGVEFIKMQDKAKHMHDAANGEILEGQR
jgi:hypothetical protein